MPEFVNPFSGMIPGRKMSKQELVRGLRLSLSAEEEATHLYESLADATDDAVAKAVLHDIADEERVHVGEFQRLISILLPDEDGWLADGAAEVNAMAAKVKGGEAPAPAEKPVASIGNMKS